VSTQKKSVARMPRGLCPQELPPAGPVRARSGIDAGLLENRPHRTGGDLVAKPGEFVFDCAPRASSPSQARACRKIRYSSRTATTGDYARPSLSSDAAGHRRDDQFGTHRTGGSDPPTHQPPDHGQHRYRRSVPTADALDQLGGEVGDVLVEFLGRAAVIRFAVIVSPLVEPLMRTVLPTGNCCAVPGVFLVPNCV
jgi:hypothetical protein